MASRIPSRVRQLIIGFSSDPRRGEVARFCREHQISVAAFYKIRAVARADGPEAALLARSTAPRSTRRTEAGLEKLALEVRSQLAREGWDHGPLSVAAKLRSLGLTPPSRASLARIFTRHGVVVAAPTKRPRASYTRFRYPDPNGCWQLDGTDYTLDNATTWCLLQVLDDHSRFILASLVAPAETSNAAITVVADAIGRHGPPAKFLTDNGTAFNMSRRGKTTPLERFLRAKGVTPITGRPYKPTTQGKSERLHQTLQRFLDAHRPITSPDRLAELVDTFADYYNTQRPHQALDHPDQTPQQAYDAAPKALPAPPATIPALEPHRRRMSGETSITTSPDAVRWADRTVDARGRVNICYLSIHIGLRHARQAVHAMYDRTTIEVFDNNGVFLATALRPATKQQTGTTTETEASTKS